jgi:hypothetical protein
MKRTPSPASSKVEERKKEEKKRSTFDEFEGLELAVARKQESSKDAFLFHVAKLFRSPAIRDYCMQERVEGT